MGGSSGSYSEISFMVSIQHIEIFKKTKFMRLIDCVLLARNIITHFSLKSSDNVSDIVLIFLQLIITRFIHTWNILIMEDNMASVLDK